ELLERLLPRGAVLACELFSPLPRSVELGAPPPFRLGALHPEERRDALLQASRTIELADSLDARVVLLPAVELDIPSTGDVLPLLPSRTAPRAWEALRLKRAAAAARHLDSLL